MYIALYVILAILVLFFLLTIIAPKKYNVSRSVEINKSIDEVYEYLRFIKNQDHWSPWKKRDPNMVQTDTGVDGTIGFTVHWDSDHKQVGSGEQEISNLEKNKRIEATLRFLKPFKSVSQGFFDLEETGSGTKVTWGFYGNHKVPVNVMMLFLNMDKLVGKDFEEGLSDLKIELEK